MKWFDFGEPKKKRRRRSEPGPIECLPAESTSRPLPSFNKVPPLASSIPQGPSTTEPVADTSVLIGDISETDAPTTRAAETPRHDHYGLVHRSLRELAFAKPAALLRALASEDAPRILDELLRRLAIDRSPSDVDAGFSGSDVRIHKVRAGRSPCLIVEMPPPAISEAYYVAILTKAESRVAAAPLVPGDIRYFTLERAAASKSPSETTIGEWTAAGAHRTFGAGPPPQLEKFIHTLSGMAH